MNPHAQGAGMQKQVLNSLIFGLLFILSTGAAQAESFSLRIECASQGQPQVELSGVLVLESVDNGDYQIQPSSSIYVLRASSSEQTRIQSGLVRSQQVFTQVQLIFSNSLQANIRLVSRDAGSEESSFGSLMIDGQVQRLSCSQSQIRKNGFSIRNLLQMPFPD